MKKKSIYFNLGEGSPYYEVKDLDNEVLCYRQEYVDICVEQAYKIWGDYGFLNDLTVIYEDKYSDHYKGEEAFIASCIRSIDEQVFKFDWYDEEERYQGIRYIWHAKEIEERKLFRKIILSDIGEDTKLDCAVYIMDNKTGNIYFLCDDRGVEIFIDER